MNRWIRSKHAGTLPDRLIELRITLESLYEIEEFEKGFRLSTYGAWLLGKDFNDPCSIHDSMKKIYSASSKAVHGGRLKCDANLVEEGQVPLTEWNFEMGGRIRKPDWVKLIMGNEKDSAL